MPRPGEVSLAHNGVLFLDEFPEFPRNVLEMLRQPLEDGSVTIARSNMTLSFPSTLHVGRRHEPVSVRISTAIPRANAAARPAKSSSYLGKISGPLLDRIDIHVEVPAVPFKELRGERRSRILRRDPRPRRTGPRGAAERADTTTPACPPAWSASSARSTKPASARWKWRFAAWASRPARTTAS